MTLNTSQISPIIINFVVFVEFITLFAATITWYNDNILATDKRSEHFISGQLSEVRYFESNILLLFDFKSTVKLVDKQFCNYKNQYKKLLDYMNKI